MSRDVTKVEFQNAAEAEAALQLADQDLIKARERKAAIHRQLDDINVRESVGRKLEGLSEGERNAAIALLKEQAAAEREVAEKQQ